MQRRTFRFGTDSHDGSILFSYDPLKFQFELNMKYKLNRIEKKGKVTPHTPQINSSLAFNWHVCWEQLSCVNSMRSNNALGLVLQSCSCVTEGWKGRRTDGRK